MNSAVKVALDLGVSEGDVEQALGTFVLAFGRGEHVSVDGKEFTIFLAKNPASFNSNLKEVGADSAYENLIFILNDRIPDGRDVSWIYDVGAGLLRTACAGKKVYVFGDRVEDMEIRLGYADVTEVTTLGADYFDSLPDGSYVVLPNYSAMLEFREVVLGRDIL